jgi:hypothetical protein
MMAHQLTADFDNIDDDDLQTSNFHNQDLN